MNLLFVIDSLGSGGAQRQMVQLARGFVARGHHVEFFIYSTRHNHFRSALDDAGIRIHQFDKPSRYSPTVVWRLAALMRRGSFDVVLAYLTTPGVYAEVAARILRVGGTRIPVVVSERGPLADVSARLRLALGAHRLAAHVVTNSRNNREQLLSLWPALRHRASVIYNGIDLHVFSPGRAEPAVTPGQLRILAVGTLLPTKDAATLVNALHDHRERHGWAPTVSWVGKLAPNGGDAGYERFIRERLSALGLEDHWDWTGERHDVADLLRTHDLLVHPSVLEGLPNAVCEALACGLPVVAARIGDNEALVLEGATGFLHAAGDAVGLSDAIATFAALPAEARLAMRRAARAFAVDNLSLEQCVAKYEGLFHRLLAGANTHVG